MSTTLPAGALALAAIVAAVPAAAATSYHLVDLGPSSQALDINRKGEIAGSSPDGPAGLWTHGEWRVKNDTKKGSLALAIDDKGDMVGNEWHKGRIVHLMYYPRGFKDYEIPLPGGANYGWSINPPEIGMSPDGTQVAGTFMDPGSRQHHCFLWHPGDAVATDIGLPAGGFSRCAAWDVNDAGEIVGQLWGTDTIFAAFVYRDGEFRIVGPQGWSGGELRAVNRKGHAVGDNGTPWFWNGRHLRTIPKDGDLEMDYPTALNERDEIVGWGSSQVVLYSNGVLVDVVPLIDDRTHWEFRFGGGATGINEKGEISGWTYYDDGSGTESPRGYILVPND